MLDLIINVDLEFLDKHPNLDVIRNVVEFENVNSIVVEDKVSKISKKNKKNEVEELDKNNYGYKQIVIFDYETRSNK
jgi:hypothetical protein